jgi:glycosyltransferase involved in cell wall biosynthesis
MKTKKINDTAVIIPAYNEEKVIRSNLEEVLDRFEYVIVVNDGSTDHTGFEARKTKAIVIDHVPYGLGQGGALQTGIEYALTLPVSFFVTFDADGQHRLQDAIEMREEMLTGKYDIVLGSRFLGVESTGMPKSKRILLRAAVKFSNLTSGLKLTDAHNGLRVFNKSVAGGLDIREANYQHASEITDKIAQYAWKYKEVPVHVVYSDYSKSKGQSIFNAINLGFDIISGKVIRR